MAHVRDTLGTEASRPIAGLLTSPFVHGFSTVSLVPHLAGNLVLLWYAGSRVETGLGTARFALLTLGALAAYAAIQTVGALEVNGASVFVWAYAPGLAILHRSGLRTDCGPTSGDTAAAPIVLTVMWVVVPLLMTAVPYSFGWSGSPVRAFLVANTFHISATVVGIGGAWAWREQLSSEPSASGTSASAEPETRRPR